jgi:pantoate kinase
MEEMKKGMLELINEEGQDEEFMKIVREVAEEENMTEEEVMEAVEKLRQFKFTVEKNRATKPKRDKNREKAKKKQAKKSKKRNR